MASIASMSKTPVYLLFSACLAAGPCAAGQVTFHEAVVAAISKAGCNLGTCHGNATGKGGWRRWAMTSPDGA